MTIAQEVLAFGDQESSCKLQVASCSSNRRIDGCYSVITSSEPQTPTASQRQSISGYRSVNTTLHHGTNVAPIEVALLPGEFNSVSPVDPHYFRQADEWLTAVLSHSVQLLLC